MVCSFADPVKIKEWTDICQLMKTLDKMVCFKFTPNELTIQMIHPSKRCVLDMKFPNTWFSTYEWITSEFYIPTDSLYAIFSLYSGERMITMESEKKYLTIKCFHESQTKSFSIPIRTNHHHDICIEPEKGVQFMIETTYFYSLCKELHQFGHFVIFNIKPEIFHMISHGNEKMVVEIQPHRMEILSTCEYEQSYELVYLLLFLKFSLIDEKVMITLNTMFQASIEKEYVLHFYLSRIKS